LRLLLWYRRPIGSRPHERPARESTYRRKALAGGCQTPDGVLHGVRVELADEQTAQAGLELAGLGADMIKVEPPQGSGTRRIGPFAGDGLDVESSVSSGSTTARVPGRCPRP
jgi:hypothetical protein